MDAIESTLAELAGACGLQPRTIRSWVAQGLLPGPISRGPFARYPAETLERLQAIRSMRDLFGMSLAAIRQELLVASPDQIRAYAAKSTALAPEAADRPRLPPPSPSAALDYLRGLRASPSAGVAQPVMPSLASDAVLGKPIDPEPLGIGFEGLERRLAEGRTSKPPARKAHGEEWLHISVTPDVELTVRGRLDGEQRTRLERCADLIRDILLGRDR